MRSRREFLKLLGLGGLAAGLSGGAVLRAFAQDSAAAPKRLIIIGHCHGWPYEAWRLRPEGLSEDAPWSIDLTSLPEDDFSQPLAPLYPHRHRLLALDGLSLASAELDVDGNRHDTGWVHAWTGNAADFSSTDTRATALSLDQLVAAHIARGDKLPSLELSVEDALEPGRPISYNPVGGRLPVENTPLRAWQRVFGPASSGNPLGSRQRSTLDYAYAEYQALAPKLGADDRARLDTHFELIQSLGARLEGLANLSCELGAQPEPTFARYDQRFDAFSELISAAFSCDVTRVVTLSLGEMPTADFGADDITDDVHKGLAHEIYNDPVKHGAMTDYLTLHAHQVSRLVSTLEAIPDVDGSSLMDNTLIVWGSELADGWHGYRHYCPVIIGGSWAFETGRYMHWPHTTPVEMLVPATVATGGYTRFSGQPHQRLLVSVAQAMGLDIDHVGLKHVRGQRGDLIDCTSPLDGLTG